MEYMKAAAHLLLNSICLYTVLLNLKQVNSSVNRLALL